MARLLRIEYPGAHYHVINQRNNQKKLLKKRLEGKINLVKVNYAKFKLDIIGFAQYSRKVPSTKGVY